jgi:hydroxymethylpyrimidine/phosphomethylpyrimidine kinase
VKTALTIAGSDSGGCAGIQADLRTFSALGVHGTSALTALTAQSTVEVREVHAVPAAFVRAQLETVLDDFDVKAAKTGMLANASITRAVAEVIEARKLVTVVDPVMIASSGAVLIDEEAIAVLKKELLPRAIVVTPNLPELEKLIGFLPEAIDEMIDAARVLLRDGANAVLVKGGHRIGAPIDILVERTGEPLRLESPRIDTNATHGTGCTYAAAIAAFLARGETLRTAVERAHAYLFEAIARAPKNSELGRGKGPVHHMHLHYPWP